MNQQEYNKNYYDYFEELEGGIIQLKPYVHFSKRNFKTFSYEITKLIQLICSEIDIVAKVILNEHAVDLKSKYSGTININKWGFELQKIYKEDLYVELIFNDDIRIIPFNHKWKYEKKQDKNKKQSICLTNNGENPKWWTIYNKVKHERTVLVENNESYFEKANFENMIYAFGGLYILENILYKEIYQTDENMTSLLCKIKE